MRKILLAGMLLLGLSLSLDAGGFEDYKKACDGGDTRGVSTYGGYVSQW